MTASIEPLAVNISTSCAVKLELPTVKFLPARKERFPDTDCVPVLTVVLIEISFSASNVIAPKSVNIPTEPAVKRISLALRVTPPVLLPPTSIVALRLIVLSARRVRLLLLVQVTESLKKMFPALAKPDAVVTVTSTPPDWRVSCKESAGVTVASFAMAFVVEKVPKLKAMPSFTAIFSIVISLGSRRSCPDFPSGASPQTNPL